MDFKKLLMWVAIVVALIGANKFGGFMPQTASIITVLVTVAMTATLQHFRRSWLGPIMVGLFCGGLILLVLGLGNFFPATTKKSAPIPKGHATVAFADSLANTPAVGDTAKVAKPDSVAKIATGAKVDLIGKVATVTGTATPPNKPPSPSFLWGVRAGTLWLYPGLLLTTFILFVWGLAKKKWLAITPAVGAALIFIADTRNFLPAHASIWFYLIVVVGFTALVAFVRWEWRRLKRPPNAVGLMTVSRATPRSARPVAATQQVNGEPDEPYVPAFQLDGEPSINYLQIRLKFAWFWIVLAVACLAYASYLAGPEIQDHRFFPLLVVGIFSIWPAWRAFARIPYLKGKKPIVPTAGQFFKKIFVSGPALTAAILIIFYLMLLNRLN